MRRVVWLVAVAACSKIANIPSYGPDDSSIAVTDDSDRGSDAGTQGSGSCAWGNAGCVTALSAGYHRTCAVAGGNLYCWGNYPGDGSVEVDAPIGIAMNAELVSSSTTTVESSGYGLTCFTAGGLLGCWGDGEDAEQQGDMTTSSFNMVTSPLPLIRLAAGGDHVCVGTDTGVSCWGAIGSGQCGSNAAATESCDSGSCTTNPTVIYADQAVDQVSAGLSHTCAHDTAGAVTCWGRNDDGQLGNGTFSFEGPSNVFAPADGVTQIDAGGTTTCAIEADNSWSCWGTGGTGQLGNGTESNQDAPSFHQAPALATIAVGNSSTCGITPMGDVYCWGDNTTGVSGSDVVTTDIQEDSPWPKGLANAKLISVGYDHACAALADGEIDCWGNAFEGALGVAAGGFGSCDYLSGSHCTWQPQRVPPPAEPY